MPYFGGLFGVLVLGLVIFAVVDVTTTDDGSVRNLPKLLLLLLVLLFSVVLLAGCGADARKAPGPSPSTSDGPADFQARWWTWASQPAATNPVTDTSGRFCGRDQPVDVWFLAGSLTDVPVRRLCRVPADKPLLVPVANLAGQVADCEAFMKSARGEVLLNGSAQPLTTVPATPFTYEARAGNPFGSRTGRIDSVGCGLWAWVGPPASGEHELVVRGSGGSRQVDVTYELIVGAD
ncbi:hypothetical protein [Lentzea sp. NPDC059081]|uniref:hypothetical protein n=1 Tax=Lentzea sp. NPDC059081 TaxID=3346719 RepID=UPI0036B938BA